METTCEEIKVGRNESLTRVGALFLIAIAAMLVVGFQFVGVSSDDAPGIEGTALTEQ